MCGVAKHHIAAGILYVVAEDLIDMPSIPESYKLKEALSQLDEAREKIQDLIDGRR